MVKLCFFAMGIDYFTADVVGIGSVSAGVAVFVVVGLINKDASKSEQELACGKVLGEASCHIGCYLVKAHDIEVVFEVVKFNDTTEGI